MKGGPGAFTERTMDSQQLQQLEELRERVSALGGYL